MTFLRITVPLMLGGIVGGFVLTFVTVASELSATIVLYSGPWTTMTGLSAVAAARTIDAVTGRNDVAKRLSRC